MPVHPILCAACSDVCVLVLDRPRHKDIIQQCRAAGARIRLISDGDVGGAIQVAKAGTPVDMLVGIGGTPEGALMAQVQSESAFSSSLSLFCSCLL